MSQNRISRKMCLGKHQIKWIDARMIKSKWHKDLLTDWAPDKNYIKFIQKNIKQNRYIAPVIVVKEKEGYYIVNGHHRCYASMEMGEKKIKCIVIEGTFEESEPLRKAEVLLKKFDQKTNHRYQFSGYLDRWAASVEGCDFTNKYRPTLRIHLYKLVKKIRRRLLSYVHTR